MIMSKKKPSKKQAEKQRSVLGNEFVQFLGGVIDKMTAPSGAFEGRPQAAAHELIAVVAEELLKLTYDKDNDTDFFRAKPLVRAAMFLLERYKSDIESADVDEKIKKRVLADCDTSMRTLKMMTEVEEDDQ